MVSGGPGIEVVRSIQYGRQAVGIIRSFSGCGCSILRYRHFEAIMMYKLKTLLLSCDELLSGASREAKGPLA